MNQTSVSPTPKLVRASETSLPVRLSRASRPSRHACIYGMYLPDVPIARLHVLHPTRF